MIEDIVNENIEQFKYVRWLDWSNKVKYIDLFKRGITSGDTLGLFFIKDSKAVCELVKYYKDFKRIIIYDSNTTTGLLKDYDSINEFNDPRVEYFDVGQDIFMKFDKIIMNPPYNLGNKITEAVLSVLEDNGECICLQPLSQYKKKDLYRHVESFELADPSLFEDAVITENLSICTLKKNIVDRYTWQDLVLESVDPKYKLAYEYNILHFDEYKLYPTQKVYITKDDLDVKTDFIDSSRVFSSSHGAIPSFRKQSDCYKYNTQYDESCINKGILVIKFMSEKAKDNFCKYAYNYDTLEERNTHLCGKLMKGLRIVSAAQEYYFFIPQIDWSNIHINQKELWDKGDYDNAVLSEMGLKWNEDKTVIVKDE